MNPTLVKIGDQLGVDPADLEVLVAEMVDLHDDVIPVSVAIELRSILSPCGERTMNAIWDDADEPL